MGFLREFEFEFKAPNLIDLIDLIDFPPNIIINHLFLCETEFINFYAAPLWGLMFIHNTSGYQRCAPLGLIFFVFISG